MENNLNNIIIILATPIFVVLLFQLSSYLNRTMLSSGLITIEMEDFCNLTNLDSEKVRMIPQKNDRVKFKILDDENKEIAYAIFSLELLRLEEFGGMEIDNKKFQEFRRIKFSEAIKVKPQKIKISEDGNTFSQISFDEDGNEVIEGSVTFDENEQIEVTGLFKKYF